MEEADVKNGVHYLKFLFDTGENAGRFQEKLAALFPALLYVYDSRSGTFRYINNRYTDLLGYSEEDIASNNSDFMQLVLQEDAAVVQASIQQCHQLKEDESTCFDCRLLHKKGQQLHFRTKGTVLERDDAGQPLSFLFVSQDITDTVISRQEIQAGNELVREMEEQLQFGSWSWEKETGNVYWSEGIYRILDISKDAVAEDQKNEYFFSRVHPAYQDYLKNTIDEALQNHHFFDATFIIIDASGTEKVLTTRCKIVRDQEGAIIKIFGTTSDVTDQEKKNADLMQFRELAGEKEKFLGYGSWEFNLDTQEISWSDGMYELFGYDAQKEKKQLHIDTRFYKEHMPPEQSGFMEKQLAELSNGTQADYTLEYDIITKQQTAKKIQSFGKVIRDSDGKAIKIYGISRDITSIRQYENSLEASLQELKRSNKELEEFAYIASHDLQEPLRKLTTFNERLQKKFAGLIDSEGHAYLTRMMNATQNMRLLIDNLLDYSRTASAAKVFARTDLHELLKKTLTDLELVIEETQAKITVQSLPVAEVIPSQISQLFNNLITNAIKFRKSDVPPEIQISSRLMSAKEKDEQHLYNKKDYYKITIKDNGIGFEEIYAQRIFQIFQRLNGKSEYPGSGIGLSICKKIADNHHGLIYAHSIVDQGSVFVFILPVHP